jgi:hypothetical protein
MTDTRTVHRYTSADRKKNIFDFKQSFFKVRVESRMLISWAHSHDILYAPKEKKRKKDKQTSRKKIMKLSAKKKKHKKRNAPRNDGLTRREEKV